MYFESYTVNYFKEALSIVKKAERTILASKGYTVNDDIDKVIADYQKDLEKERKTLQELQSDKHKGEVERGVREKKSAMKISGKTIDERVEEFKKLNHLLSYKFFTHQPSGMYHSRF
jgi:dynactin complex subunit